MANLDKEQRWKGVITSSASDALAVSYAAKKFRTPSIIVLPEDTAKTKIKELTRLGSTVKLHGRSTEAAKEECLRLQSLHDLIAIPQPGDEYVISGCGTIGREITQQTTRSQVQGVFCPVTCGTLIAGLGIYLKRIAPNIKVIGVQLHDSADISRLIHCKGQPALEEHLLSRSVCPKIACICSNVIDDIVQVTMNEVLIATKNIYEDARQLVNTEGALAVAGMKSWIMSNGFVGSEKDFIAITSEAQLDFSEISSIVKQASLAEMAMGSENYSGLDSLMHIAGTQSTCAGDGWSSSTTVAETETTASFTSDVDGSLLIHLQDDYVKVSRLITSLDMGP
ncbi:Threonine dehydratase mitochondrial [Fusarium coicis]|nr:Threonine dehydratase mitochondrial [Fusarium coicis]